MKKLLTIDTNPNRTYGLDILRASAILFVVAEHGQLLIPDDKAKYLNPFILDGVNIFFVLSGFLIGGILIKLVKENTVDSKLIINFWIRRWFRTLPNYFLILATLVILNVTFVDSFSICDKLCYFLFSQNLFYNHPVFFPEAWSLCVEEWFYLLIPLAIAFIIKTRAMSTGNSILFTAFTIIISVTLFRFFKYDALTIESFSTWDRAFRKQVFTRLDSLMYGVIGAYIYHNFRNFWNKYRLPFLGIGISLFILMKAYDNSEPVLGLFYCVFSFSIYSLATLFTLPYLSQLESRESFFVKPVTYISLISYSMYLVNFTLIQGWILEKIDWTLIQNINGYTFLIIRYIMYWLFTIIISIIIFKYFETPVMNLRDKLKPQ